MQELDWMCIYCCVDEYKNGVDCVYIGIIDEFGVVDMESWVNSIKVYDCYYYRKYLYNV